MTTPAGHGTKYDHSQIRDIARQIRRELATHSSTSLKIPATAFGIWDAARALSSTVDQGNTQITRAHQRLLDDVLFAANALEKAAENYRDADEKTLSGIRSITTASREPMA
ncbi:hypothetical protein [Actinomadura sp. CNU-125]|uniref:hypothetical protein n=1 Tax=Actinomadura sp. CNU-125 TaxID=1904961 RepID=UPI001178A66A|nr:hypothetical protein [Actinomadura sp. CNU-125]